MRARSLVLSLVVVVASACTSNSTGGAPPPDDFDASLFGLVIDPSAPPSAESVRTLGARWVRASLVAGEETALDAALRSYRCLGIKTLLVLDGASFTSTSTVPKDADDAGWSTYAMRFAASAESFVRAHDSEIDAVEIWSEPDLPNDAPDAHPSSKHFALVMQSAFPRLKRILFDRPVIQGAISGANWPGYLDDVDTRLASASITVDGFAFHPYGLRASGYPSTWPPQAPGDDGSELSNVLVEVSYTANAHNPPGAPTRPIWITEIGLPPSDAPDGVSTFVKNLYGTTETDHGGPHVLQALRDEGVVAHAFWLGWSSTSSVMDPLGKKMFSPLADGATTNDAGKTYATHAGAIPACDHASESGADGSKTLADLGDDEKAKLCDWTASTQGGYGKAYLCDGMSTSIAKANVAQCVASIPKTCAATVAQTEGCVKAVVATGDACQVLARPECAAVRRCDWRGALRGAADPYFALSADNATFGPPQANLLASLGAGMVRLNFDRWDAQQSALLARVDAAIAANLHVLIELNYGSTGDLDDDGKGCSTDECQRARQHRWHDGYTPAGNAYAQKFAAMASSVAKAVKPHLMGTTARYEIWNEPDAPPNRNDGSIDLPSQSSADWDHCTDAGYDYGVRFHAGQWALCPQQLGVITTNAFFAIKKEDPDALVVAGNVILQGDAPLGWVAHDYWSYVEKSDAVQYAWKTMHRLPWDEVGFHPYARVPVDGDLGAALTYFSGALTDAGDGSAIALTEYGWSTGRAPSSDTVTSAENQAAYLSQVFALARNYGVSFVSWFDYLSTTEDFGLRDPIFSSPDDGTKGWKPAATAFCRSAGATACPAH